LRCGDGERAWDCARQFTFRGRCAEAATVPQNPLLDRYGSGGGTRFCREADRAPLAQVERQLDEHFDRRRLTEIGSRPESPRADRFDGLSIEFGTNVAVDAIRKGIAAQAK